MMSKPEATQLITRDKSHDDFTRIGGRFFMDRDDSHDDVPATLSTESEAHRLDSKQDESFQSREFKDRNLEDPVREDRAFGDKGSDDEAFDDQASDEDPMATGLPDGSAPKPESKIEPFSDQNDQYADALRPGTIIEDFRIDEVIGVGGFGIVYKALDLKLSRETAVKEYFPHSLARRTGGGRVRLKADRHQRIFDAGMKSFINEAQILAKFDHPSLVKVYRFWEQNSTAYMAMPYYQGDTLKSKLQNGDFDRSEDSVRSLIVSLAQALQIMHASKCLHRDVSPDNVLILEESGQPVLLDFGAARKTINASSNAFTVILKSGYAPIEQYSEIPHLEQGPWTDVYALGALACHALTGQAPPPSVGRMVCDSAPRLAETLKGKGCSEEFLQTIDHCLAVLPDDRPQSMASLIRALAPHATETSRLESLTQHFVTKTRPRPPTVQKQTKNPPNQKKLMTVWIGILALLFFSSLGGGMWMIREAAQQKDLAQAARGSSPAQVAARKFEQQPAQKRLLTLSTPKKTLVIDQDYLEFELSSSQGGYLWVFLHGTDGRLMQIFPNEHSPGNWLEAGEIFRFPQSQQALMAAGPAGENHFLVVNTANPLDNWRFPHAIDHGYKVISWNSAQPLQKLEQSLYRELGCQPLKSDQLDQPVRGGPTAPAISAAQGSDNPLAGSADSKGCEADLAAVLEFSIFEVRHP